MINEDEKILGVIWDGAGYGSDHNIWGSEYFIYREYSFERFTHLKYFAHLAQDKMPREPRLSALSLCHSAGSSKEIIRTQFSTEEWNIYNHLLNQENEMRSSSMGRLFDAVASLMDKLESKLMKVKLQCFYKRWLKNL